MEEDEGFQHLFKHGDDSVIMAGIQQREAACAPLLRYAPLKQCKLSVLLHADIMLD